MSKPKQPKRPRDPNERAFEIFQESTREREFPPTVPIGELPDKPAEPTPEPPKEKNPHAVALGKLGGSKGGKKRAANLTSQQRVEIARKAAKSRWKQPED